MQCPTESPGHLHQTLGFWLNQRGNAVVATPLRKDSKMTIYCKKFAEARKNCAPGYTTLYCAKMNAYYNGVAF